jgi:hypothetical protein
MTLPLPQLLQRNRFTKLAIGVPGFIPKLASSSSLGRQCKQPHLNDEFGGFHDESSSASRVTAGAAPRQQERDVPVNLITCFDFACWIAVLVQIPRSDDHFEFW